MRIKGNSGQVWIETVVYTLIGLTIMGVLLAFVKPAIDEKKDQILLDQSERMLRSIENIIEDVRYYGVGNRRVMDIKIKKGELIISPENDTIEFISESEYMYSEPGSEISLGKLNAITTKIGEEKYEIKLSLEYETVNITTNNGLKKTYSSSPTPYKISITNEGDEIKIS